MSAPLSNSELIAGLAEEFVARYRAGERPPISEYTARRPELAREIREFFEAVALIENLAPSDSRTVTGPEQPGPDPGSEQLNRLGDYRIIREVGRGGMGVVYEAEQLSLGRHVALKVLPAQLLVDDKQRLRFEREAKAAARLHHTNIVPVFGVGHEGGTHYYVMQFIQGKGLDQVLDDLRQLRLQRMLASAAGEVGGPESYGAGSPGALEDVPAASLAKSLLDGRFHETQIDPALGDLAANAHSEDAPQTVCRGGSPLTPPAGQTTEEQPSLGSQNASHASEPGSLPNDRGPTSESPAGGVTGLPPRHDRSSGFLLPTDSNSASGSKSRLPTYWESVARIGTQIASALQYAHGQGVLHRDIKPSNLLLDLRATVWITDFGLAKADDQENLTHTGEILGTVRYMAPEAFDGKTDLRSDLYALGLTLYELLAFRPAFDERDRRKLIQQVTEANPVRLERLDKSIPRDLATIVHKAIEREPAHRYQTGQELADDLQRFLNDEPIHARRISSIERFTRWRRRNRGLAAAGITVAALLMAVALGSSIAAEYFRQLNSELTTTVTHLNRANTDLDLEKQKSDAAATRAEAQKAIAEAASEQQQKLATENEHISDSLREQLSVNNRRLYNAQIQLAYAARNESHGSGRAAELQHNWSPRAGEDDSRGWEWYYLDNLRDCESRNVPASGNLVLKAKFSPDGLHFATANGGGGVRILETETGKLISIMRGHSGLPTQVTATAIAWSPAGDRLASGGRDGRIVIWEASSGRCVVDVQASDSTINVLSYSHDGQFLAAGSNSSVSIWKSESLTRSAEYRGDCSSLAWDPSDHRLLIQQKARVAILSAPDLNQIQDVEQSSLTELGRLNFNGFIPRGCVDWSEDGRSIAYLTDAAIVVRDSSTLDVTNRLHELGVHGDCFRFNRDSSRLVAAGTDATIRIWSLDHGKLERTLRGIQGLVGSVDWHPDNRRLLTSGAFGVRVSQPESGGEPSSIALEDGAGRAMCWSPDGHQIAVITSHGMCDIVDWASREVVRQFSVAVSKRSPVVAWHPRLPWVLCSGTGVPWQLFDVISGAELELPAALQRAGTGAAWSPDGTRLATGGLTGEVNLWDVTDWHLLQTMRGPSGPALSLEVVDIQWSPDGNRVAVAADADLWVWEVATSALLHHSRDTTFRLAWSHSGKRLAIARNPHTIVDVLDTDTWQPSGRLVGASRIQSVDWNQDDSRICTSAASGAVKIWDSRHYDELLTLHPESGFTPQARWSPNSLQLAWIDATGTLTIADAEPGYARNESPTLLPFLNSRIAGNAEDINARQLRHRIFERLRDEPAAQEDRERLIESLQRRIREQRDSVAARSLARLLLENRRVDWTVWNPSHTQSRLGDRLTQFPDGRNLTTGAILSGDSYFISGIPAIRRIAAIRLETLRTQAFFGGGPGVNNNAFSVSGMRFWIRNGSGEARRIRVLTTGANDAHALTENGNPAWGPDAMDDDDQSTVWGNLYFFGHDIWLILVPAEPIELQLGDEILAELQFTFPESSQATFRLGCFRFAFSETAPDLLLEEAAEAIEREEMDPFLTLALAQTLCGTPDQALETLQSLGSEPDRPEASIISALALQRLDRNSESRRALEAALSFYRDRTAPTLANSVLQQVFRETLGLSIKDAYITVRQLEELPILSRLDSAIARHPESVEPVLMRGHWHAVRGHWAQAATGFRTALVMNPQITLRSCDLAGLLRQVNDTEGISTLTTLLLSHDPVNLSPRECAMIARTCLLATEAPQATDRLRQLVERAGSQGTGSGPQGPASPLLLAQVRSLLACRLGDFEQAIAACREGTELIRRNPVPQPPWIQPTATALFLAIEAQCEARRGRSDAAGWSLTSARRNLDEWPLALCYSAMIDSPVRFDWSDRLAAELLTKEAAAALEKAIPLPARKD